MLWSIISSICPVIHPSIRLIIHPSCHGLFILTGWRKSGIQTWRNEQSKGCCCNPTLREREDETHILEMGTWESFGTPKISEFNCKGQNTLHWGVFHTIGKLSKCRCRKWAHMGHLDVHSTCYGKKKSWESNWQFDSPPLKFENQTSSSTPHH